MMWSGYERVLRIDDEEVLNRAEIEERIVLTFDKDFENQRFIGNCQIYVVLSSFSRIPAPSVLGSLPPFPALR